MSILNDIEKFVKPHHIVILLGLVVVVVALMQYSNNKGMMMSGFTESVSNSPVSNSPELKASVVGAPALQPDRAAPVTGLSGQPVLPPPTCNQQPVLSPADLLPRDSNSEWAALQITCWWCWWHEFFK